MAKPRVLMFPFPALGHVKPFLSLAELLSDAGLDVVFLNSEYNHRRISNVIESLSSRFPSLRFETIPDGLPPDQPRSPVDSPLFITMRDGTKPRFREVIQSFNVSCSGNPWPITCIINDVMLSSPIEVAEEFGIPVISFCTYSARYFYMHFLVPKLVEEGQIPYTDENPVGKIEGIPLFEGHLQRNHLPGFWSQQAPHISFSHSLINQTLPAARSSALIINTFDNLEAPFLTHLSSIFNKIYTIGPLHTLFKSKLRNSSSPPPTLVGFWKEDEACISWLDSQPPGSVVFVSFGSSMKMEARELTEFWHGLINSGKRFLFVLRSDGVYGGESAELIKQLVGGKGYDRNGIVVEWADQEKVLSHPAIGGFFTHCGWNSILESIVAGVPMIGWPFLGDQASNAAWMDKVWKIGIERNDEKNWERSTVEMMVRELIDGQKGMEFRRSVKKLSKLANENVVKGGLSFDNLEYVVQHIKNLKKC